MSSLSYAMSTVLLIVPFISAAIIKSSITESNPNSDKSYGQWLAVGFFFVLLIEIIRLLYREITISNIIEASKKFKVVKKKKFLDVSSEEGGYPVGYSIFYLLKVLINIPGYIMSFIFFPKTNLSYYFGLIALFTMLLAFCIIFSLSDKHSEDSLPAIRGAMGGTVGGVIFLYLALRFSSD
jgi:hypothetical protein